MIQRFIIIRGAPATGKSAIARMLRNFEKKIVWLKVDNFKDFFGEESEEAIQNAYKSAIPMLSYLFDDGFSVVMDGIFKKEHIFVIDKARQEAKKRNIPTRVFQLQASLETLYARDKQRSEETNGIRKQMSKEAITQLNQDIQDSPVQNSIILDTETHTFEECLREIKDSFDR